MFNTVGYFNYRYFYSFLLYVFVAMVYGSIITYKPFLSVQSYEYRQQLLQSRREGFTTTQHLYPWIPIPSERAAVGFSFLLCLSIGFAVLTLLGFHTYLLLTAQTTIEFHANWASRRKAKKLNKKWKNPYDLGWKRNVQQVYGAGTSWFWSLILPSGREPDYLPLPLPGKEGLRPGKMANINKDVHANTV
jgi:palmitoyltransferase